MDGMNSQGLYIANLNNDYDAVLPDTSDTTKKYVQTTVAIRYILDKCATVEEARNWLNTIVMCPVYGDMVDEDGDPACWDYHFAIADNTGESGVIEWVDGKLEYRDTKIVTNHSLVRESTNTNDENYDYKEEYYIDPDNPEDDDWKEKSIPRFMSLKSALKPQMSEQQIKDALYNVQQKHSVWSVVFEPGAKRVTYYFRNPDPESVVEDKTDEDALHEARHHPIDYTKPVVIQF